jgi:hypothetical protein
MGAELTVECVAHLNSQHSRVKDVNRITTDMIFLLEKEASE